MSSLIRYGRYATPFNKDSRYAPIAAADIARIVAAVIEKPEAHIGKAYPLHGPIEYSHEELASLTGRVLGRDLKYGPPIFGISL